MTDIRWQKGVPGKVYLVGGAVRDQLLGRPVTERDWLVVGATPEQMLAAGFKQRDPAFPVFLHPRNGDEYALARRETKIAEGYRGFRIDSSPDVTLEQDLARRDFTVNALAQDDNGRIIDLFNGQSDLLDARLRHISPAFVEDPLRILRAARFAAKLGFRLAHATHRLMQKMVEQGALTELQPQRITQESMRALACDQPWRFFEVLQACAGLVDWAPDLARQLTREDHASDWQSSPLRALQRATRITTEPTLRLAALLLQGTDAATLWHSGKRVEALLKGARMIWQLGDQISALQLHDQLLQLRAWHQQGLLQDVLIILRAQPDGQRLADRLQAAHLAAARVSPADLLAQGVSGQLLGEALNEARIREITNALYQE